MIIRPATLNCIVKQTNDVMNPKHNFINCNFTTQIMNNLLQLGVLAPYPKWQNPVLSSPPQTSFATNRAMRNKWRNWNGINLKCSNRLPEHLGSSSCTPRKSLSRSSSLQGTPIPSRQPTHRGWEPTMHDAASNSPPILGCSPSTEGLRRGAAAEELRRCRAYVEGRRRRS
jgi:hypothetical protein